MRTEALLALLALLLAAPALADDALLGAGVGNADTLVSEGSKLFNRKDYAKASASFLKATRANPATVGTYLQLARASTLAKNLGRACYAYRVYLKVAPESQDKKKATAESEVCERQLKAARPPPPDLAQAYTDTKAAFFAALDKNELLGPGNALESLRSLVKDGFLGPELGEMGQKLGAAAVARADAVYKRAVVREAVPADELRSARPLYQAAADLGAGADGKARSAFLDGCAALADKDYKKAEQLFVEAAKADPADKDYVFFKAVALVQAGDRPGALKVLEAGLPDDTRTSVLRAAVSLGHSPDEGAAELEKLLFSTRAPPEK